MLQRYSPRELLVLLAVLALFIYSFVGRSFFSPGRLYLIVGLLVGITVHEACHALAAVQLGDPTPRLMGRLSLNPLRHLDPIGTFLILFGPFGWGKPVMFNPRNLRIDPALGSSIVSVAGPVANVVTAFLAAQPLRAATDLDPTARSVLLAIVIANVFLAAFNLIPIPPLDGFGFVSGLLPKPIAYQLEPLRQYGPLLLMVLVFLPRFVPGAPDILGSVMGPIANTLGRLIGTGRLL